MCMIRCLTLIFQQIEKIRHEENIRHHSPGIITHAAVVYWSHEINQLTVNVKPDKKFERMTSINTNSLEN